MEAGPNNTLYVYQDRRPSLGAPKRNYYTSQPITLTWNRVSWAPGYEIRVDNNANFSSLDYHNDTLTSSDLSVTFTLPANGPGARGAPWIR